MNSLLQFKYPPQFTEYLGVKHDGTLSLYIYSQFFYYVGNAGNFFSSFCKLSRSAIVTSVNAGHWYEVNYQEHHLMCTVFVLILVCDVAVTRLLSAIVPKSNGR